MHQSKLIDLLRTFSADELRSFDDFVCSPYFNKREELVSLFRQLRELAPDFPPEQTTREAVFQSAFPDKEFDEKELAYLMNYLLRLGEQFIGLQRHESAEVTQALDILSALVDRGLEKHYRFNLKKMEQYLEETKQESSDSYWNHYQLASVKDEHFGSQDLRRFDENIQEASDLLDRFYFSKKLRALCEIVNRQRLFQQSYRLEFLEETLAAVESSELLNLPGIQVYLHVLKMLTHPNPERHYQAIINTFEEHFDQFSLDDKQNILSHALNFCIRQIRVQADKQQYIEEALRLYMFGIDQNIFLDKGHLSPWHFKNVIKLAINLKRHNWAEEFIQTYSQYLQEPFRENALYYNLADLNYQRKDYDQALYYLNQVAFTDIHYQLNAKTLLLKIFYELEEEEPLLSSLAAFTVLLKRNKNISADLRKTYLNFCSLLNKALRRNPRKLASLDEEIMSTSPLTSREWLLKVLERQKSELRI